MFVCNNNNNRPPSATPPPHTPNSTARTHNATPPTRPHAALHLVQIQAAAQQEVFRGNRTRAKANQRS